jgi:hypothetical protein
MSTSSPAPACDGAADVRPAKGLWPALACGVPLALTAALCALVLCRSSIPDADARVGMRVKHTRNTSQVFPFSDEQHHPEHTRDCRSDDHGLRISKFGESQLPLYLTSRPTLRAVADHLETVRPRDAWASLNGPLPGGWQCVGDVPADRWRLHVLAAA